MDEQRPNAEQSLQLPPAPRSRRRSRAKRRSFAAGDVPLKVPLTPLRPGKRARSPPSSPVRTPAARPPLSADEYASMVGSAARQKRLGWGEGAASGEAASPGDLTAHVAPDVGRRGSRQSSRRSSSSSSDDGQRWQRAGAPLTTKRPSQPLPPLPPGAKIAAGGSDEEALLSRVYTVLREQVKHPRVLIVALRCLFVLLARAGAHTKPPGPEREEMLADPLHLMRVYPRHGGVLAAANMTVGLFTSMRLPPMLAEQESYVEEFLEWEKMRVSPTFSLPCILPPCILPLRGPSLGSNAPGINLCDTLCLPEPFYPPRCSLTRPSRRQNDRLRAIQRVLLRMQQLHIASAFSAWEAYVRQRYCLRQVRQRCISIELAARWGQWVGWAVRERSSRREGLLKQAKEAFESSNYRQAVASADAALALGQHLLLLAQSGLRVPPHKTGTPPASEEAAEVDRSSGETGDDAELGQRMAAEALQAALEAGLASADTDGVALELLEAATMAQRKHEKAVLERAVQRIRLLLLGKSFNTLHAALVWRQRREDILQSVSKRWLRCAANTVVVVTLATLVLFTLLTLRVL
eukprot:COSAG04_NODE_1506_length_6504_cov_4.962998_8_plen_578_part_00